MASRVRAELTHRGLKLETGEELDVFTGACHYWRLDPARWETCLRGMRRLGFRIVVTYVPWGVHETAPGEYDFSGPRDLGRFLDLARDVGLLAMVRPGPHINSELTGFGYPERILRDERMQARSGRDTPVWLPAPPKAFPVPSYASRLFREATAEWMRAVGEVVAPRRFPDGPVVAAQVDNESQMFFRVGAYDHDYHPDALRWWEEVSGGREAPRRWDPDNEETCLRWVAFKDEYTARSLSWVAAAMREAGLDEIPFFHNFPPTEPQWIHLPKGEAAVGGPAGIDFYHRKASYPRYRFRALYLAGTAQVLPWAPEVGMGGWLWMTPLPLSEQAMVIRALLACGVRAQSLYMAVDRDRWFGAPIRADGGERPEAAAFVRRLLHVVERTRYTRLRRRTDCALVMSRTYTRLATASSLADPLSPVVLELLDLGPARAAELAEVADARTHRLLYESAQKAMARARVSVAVVDEDVAPERMSDHRVIVVPTLERVSRSLWRNLKSLAAGGARVLCGPKVPEADEWGAPLGDDGGLPEGAVVATSEAGLARELVAACGDEAGAGRWAAEAEQPVTCDVFEDGEGSVRLVFVGAPSARRVTCEIRGEPGVRLVDCFSDEEHPTDGMGHVRLSVAPFDVRMLEVVRS